MFKKAVVLLGFSSALLGSITGCADRPDASPDTGVKQTRFPGQVTAGGGTSGEVIERSSKKVASGGDPSGTPGIPEGAGGNTSGAALGGTTSAAAATEARQDQAQTAAAKKAQADIQAEKEKQELAAAMDAIAKRWRARAAANSWPARPSTPVASIQGFNASASQSGPSGQPGGRQGGAALQAPIRSEKSGTAPPSPDVKQVAPGNSR